MVSLLALLCSTHGAAQRSPAPRESPLIAAAANLNFALTDVATQYTRDTGARVQLVFGASGALTRQLQDGAPFELFLAADETFVDRLVAMGLTKGDGVVYATGRLVLFAPHGSPLSVDPALDGLSRLVKSGNLTRFAIANPAVAPYGKAAEQVLRKRGLWERLQPHLVLGDSIAQAAQFATTGNAVGGLIAYSLALSPTVSGRGSYVLIPNGDHAPLMQKMVLLKRAGPAAEAFYRYLQGANARAALTRFGFEVPE